MDDNDNAIEVEVLTPPFSIGPESMAAIVPPQFVTWLQDDAEKPTVTS